MQNEAQGEEIVNAITSGNVQGPLGQMLNTKASQLHLQHEQLLMEARRLNELLVPLNENFDAAEITDLLRDFQALARCAEPLELQRLIRACVRRIEWKTDGNIKMQLYKVGKGYGTKTNSLPAQGASREWLYTDVCNDTPSPHGVEPLIFEAEWNQEGELQVETARIRRISRTEAFVEAALVDTRLRPTAEKLREQNKEGI